ncbi:MAG TPA: hypothetical protein VJ550_17220 [Geomonas sp.]|nr:hypothetical protein [Geomonas sp.]
MSFKEIIFCFLGGSTILFGIIAVGFLVMNSFIKQQADRCLREFRERLADEAEAVLKRFRESMAEQIVDQENKSDSMAKLYATLIDLLRVGKEFSNSAAKGEVQQAERMLVGIRNTSDCFTESYHKQRLYLSDEICGVIDGFVEEQKGVVQHLESNWRLARRDPQEAKSLDPLIKQSWLSCEDRIAALMESMRNEFRKRHVSSANPIMKWLTQAPGSKDSAPPAAP